MFQFAAHKIVEWALFRLAAHKIVEWACFYVVALHGPIHLSLSLLLFAFSSPQLLAQQQTSLIEVAEVLSPEPLVHEAFGALVQLTSSGLQQRLFQLTPS